MQVFDEEHVIQFKGDERMKKTKKLVALILMAALVLTAVPANLFAETENNPAADGFAAAIEENELDPILIEPTLASPTSLTMLLGQTLGANLQQPTISARFENSMAIRNDNSLWAWGDNYYGQLYNYSGVESNNPVKIMDSVVTGSVGYCDMMAIKTDGCLWAWGNNAYGQLGDGTAATKYSPVKIMDSVSAVSAGGYYTMAIKTDGSLWAWGLNGHGTLGDGTTDLAKMVPEKIMDSVVAVSAGDYNAMAVKTDGSLWAWGYNQFGQLGDGTQETRFSPVKVMDSVVAVSAGNDHTLAIKSDGSLWGWGNNTDGCLGNDLNDFELNPIKIMDSVIAIAAGNSYSMAIKTDGTLWTWGYNGTGYLGDGTTISSPNLIYVMDSVDEVTSGGTHAIVKKVDGSYMSWGDNGYGQLGVYSENDVELSPVYITFPPLPPIQSTEINFNDSSHTATLGDTVQIDGTFSSGALDPSASTLLWSCDDSSAVQFGQMTVSGTKDSASISIPVKCNKAGTFTITIQSTDGASAQTSLVVVEPPIQPTEIDINDSSYTATLGDTVQIDGTFSSGDLDPSASTLLWSCDDSSAVQFGQMTVSGTKDFASISIPVKFNKAGTFTISVQSTDGASAQITLVVVQSSITDDFQYTLTGTDATITGYTGIATNLVIPSLIDGYTVVAIGDWAFYYNKTMVGVTIPDSVTAIGSSAFAYCSSVTEINIPESVTSIGGGAFQGCSELSYIDIPDRVTSINDDTFSDCTGLTEITIPDSVTSLGSWVFANCSRLTRIDIPNSVTAIGDAAFYYCTGLMNITLPDSIQSLSGQTFFYCTNLTSVILGNGLTSMGGSEFAGTAINSILIPKNVVSMPSALAGTEELKTVVFEAGRTKNLFSKTAQNRMTK